MKLEMSVPELVEVFKEIQKQPEQIFEMIRLDVREIVGDYMTAMMNLRNSPIFWEESPMHVVKETLIIVMVPMIMPLR